jgi:hypothetical protein
VLTDDQRHAAERLFRVAGYDPPLRVARIVSEDERVFVVDSNAVATLPVSLAADLQLALGRKVWIVPSSPEWSDTEPLS